MKKEIHLTNELGQLNRLSCFVMETTSTLGLDEKLCMRLNLVLEEAVTNVILYAYPGESNKDITLQIEEEEGRLIITLIDAGIAFDPTVKEKPDITLSADQRQIGGLGIHLIKEIMTEVKYNRKDNKNILTLIKDIR